MCAIFLFLGCNTEKQKDILSQTDYDAYLSNKTLPTKEATLSEITFWQARLNKDSSATIELGKLSGLYTQLFDATGEIAHLYKAEALLKKAITYSAREKDTYLRALAHNYIAQHRFKEAKILLDSAYTYPDNKRLTEVQLFDVHMELGNYQMADSLLGRIKKNNDFKYLVRLSKWSDHQGNLKAAIQYLEQAMSIAESGGQKSLKVWVNSNLADYYGHAGRIEDAYKHYLMVLQLQPDHAYAKKGISWIAYAADGNTSEATRILDSVVKSNQMPDYYLMKAEIAEFEGNLSEAIIQRQKFMKAIEASNYGVMYNRHLIEIYAKTDPLKALVIANEEVENRATPASFQILAYAQLMANNNKDALITIEKHIVGKTNEPLALYYMALVFKANGMNNRVADLKEELLESSFELGPLLMRKIENLY